MGTIGLTGASGVLGRTIRQTLSSARFSSFEGDVRDRAAVEDWILGTPEIDAVIHFAAIVPTAEVEADPPAAFAINVGGTVNLAETLRRKRANAWMFVASSSHVYAPSDTPLGETSPLAPISLYGLTKLQAEQAALAYQLRFGLSVCVGRIFSFTSEFQAESYFVPSLARRILACEKNGTIGLQGGLQRRDFLATSDVAKSIDILMRGRTTGTVNIGSGLGVRLIDLAGKLAALLGRADIAFTATDDVTTSLVADVARIRGLGFEEASSLESELLAVARAAGWF